MRELVGMTLEELEELAGELGLPAYRGRQIARWVYPLRAEGFAAMTDLSSRLRRRLCDVATITRLRIVARTDAPDGLTSKYLLGLEDGCAIETVVMRYEDGRRTACISTQVGCAMGCRFCATGLAGLARNLTAGEIVDQVLAVQQDTGERITHVVLMGMGEPLANYDATLRAVRLLNAPYGAGIGMRHISISTVGLVPQIRRLASERLQLTLALSLHAATDDLRTELVPVGSRWPLSELMAATGEYARVTGRRVTFEYVLISGVNDGEDQVGGLVRLLAGLGAHVNVIPYNPVPGLPYVRPSAEAVHRFAGLLRRAGIGATVRIDRGLEIGAACGQLRRTREAGVGA